MIHDVLSLMAAEAFKHPETATVRAVLRGVVSDDSDFECYRGQPPYVADAADHPVGVVSLRNQLTSNRSDVLSSIMVPQITVGLDTNLDRIEGHFDKHNFFGLPVVETDGRLVGVVSRTAVHDAALTYLAVPAIRPWA